MNYDSSKETLLHIHNVIKKLNIVITELQKRQILHDESKLSDLEKDTFDKYTPMLKKLTYGSEEYNKALSGMKEGLKHHYENNKHHPEYWNNGIHDMSLVDLLEMLCDWIAATERHSDGDIFRSLEINQKRFGYSDELKNILKNTIYHYFKVGD